jgi:hypothetical protein
LSAPAVDGIEVTREPDGERVIDLSGAGTLDASGARQVAAVLPEAAGVAEGLQT